MSVSETDFNPRLLDLHLGHLSEAEQAELRRQIAADADLATQDAALTSAFRALNSLRMDAAPAGLDARVAARMAAAGRLRVARPSSEELATTLERRPEFVVRLGNFRDIIAIAALVVFAVGIGVPGMLHLRERQHRLGCSYNLAQLGMGLQQYANTFGASLPFAGFEARAAWMPTSEPGAVVVPNRRHVYPLLRLAFVADPRAFLCPSQKHLPMPQSEIARHNDFLEARNVSYAYQNMAGVRPSTNDRPELPVLSDDNPLFMDGQPSFDFRRLTGRDPTTANSRAHGGAGQNILSLGGHVKWTTTPKSGVDADNIWTINGVTRYTGREGPQSADDTHLLK